MGWNHQLDIHRTPTRVLFRWTDDDSICDECDMNFNQPNGEPNIRTKPTRWLRKTCLRGLGIALLRGWNSRQLYFQTEINDPHNFVAETTGTYSASKKEMTRLEGKWACFLAIEPRNLFDFRVLISVKWFVLEIIHWHLPGANETLRDGKLACGTQNGPGPRIEKPTYSHGFSWGQRHASRSTS